jgi:hypothetical protein
LAGSSSQAPKRFVGGNESQFTAINGSSAQMQFLALLWSKGAHVNALKKIVGKFLPILGIEGHRLCANLIFG